MAAFRRCILALAVLAVFAGLASAQSSSASMTCTYQSTPKLIRVESLTEQVGDILISCSGGQTVPDQVALQTVNITVNMPAAITSRITNGGTGGINISEALLLIDDPNGTNPLGYAGYGNSAPQGVCNGTTPFTFAGAGTVLAGCTAYGAHLTSTLAGNAVAPVMTNTAGVPNAGGIVSAANIYQGVISGSSVTFFGVPVLPPGTSSTNRTYRITNVKLNATALPTGQLIPSVNVGGTASNQFVFNNGPLSVGTVQASLTVGVAATSPQVCAGGTVAPGSQVAVLSFTSGGGGTFKTRILPGAGQNSAQAATASQNIPATQYANSSESGLTIPIGGGITAGLADFGTRLKAVFNNVPTNVRVFVAFNNTNSTGATDLNVAAANQGSNAVGANALAQLVLTEGASDGTSTSTGGQFATPSATGSPTWVEVTSTGTAVWEVVNAPTGSNTFYFPVYFLYTSNTVAPGTVVTANLSYAPTGAAAAAKTGLGGTTPVPSFVDPNASSPKTLATFVACVTTLLYPYVTSSSGFETGVAISNTTKDPFGTPAQAGTCSLNFYGTNPPTTNPFVTPSVTAGTTYANVTSAMAPGFTGYVIAVCQFQFGHGFAFLSQAGNAFAGSMGYLPLIITTTTRPGTATTSIPGTSENLNQ